jgi:hypothetical protein
MQPVLQEAEIQLVLQGVDLQVAATLQDPVDLVGAVDPLEVEVLDCPHLLQPTRSSPTNIPVATPSTPQFIRLFLPPLRNYHSFPTARLVKNTASLPTPSKLSIQSPLPPQICESFLLHPKIPGMGRNEII